MDEYLKLGILLIDPTGISSWGDASKAIKTAYNDRTFKNIGLAGLELLGAVPMIGKIGKISKLEKFADAAVDSKKLILKLYPEINETSELISRTLIPGLKSEGVSKMTGEEIDRYMDLCIKTDKTIKNKLISIVKHSPEMLDIYKDHPEYFYSEVMEVVEKMEDIVDKTNKILAKRPKAKDFDQFGI